MPVSYTHLFMFGAMIAGAVIGLLVAHPTMNLPVFTGFNNEKLGTMFPIPVSYTHLDVYKRQAIFRP